MARHNKQTKTHGPSKSKFNGSERKKVRKKRVRKYTLDWTVESSVALIHAVEHEEHLWNPNNQYYKDRRQKNVTWDKISRAIGVPKSEAIVRWSALRGNYLAFLKKEKEPKSRYSGGKPRRLNPLYNDMKFLIPVIDPESKLNDSNLRTSPSPVNISSTESEYCESIDSPQRMASPQRMDSPQIIDSPQRSPTPKKQPMPPLETVQPPITRSSPQRPPVAQPIEDCTPEGRTAMRSMMMGAYDMLMDNVQRSDEWDAFGNMITSNARAWSKESIGLARRYKAALSAVNAKFEMEAAEMAAGNKYIVN